MILVGVCGSCACPANDLFQRNTAVVLRLPIDVRGRAGGKAGICMAEVFGDLVDRVPAVDEERRGRVPKVVGAKVGRYASPRARGAGMAIRAPGSLARTAWIGAAKRGKPDPFAPVLAAQVATARIGEDE